MLVKFIHTWFAPSVPRQVDKIRIICGQRFKEGVHEVSEEYRDILPKTAIIVDEAPVIARQQELTLQEADVDRAASNEEMKQHELAQKRLESLAHAREVKAANRKDK